VAVVSANLHLDPDTEPCQRPTTQFFTGWMPFLPPNQQRQSIDGNEYVTKQVIFSKADAVMSI